MDFDEWWSKTEFKFGTRWLETLAKPFAEFAWNACKEEAAKVADDYVFKDDIVPSIGESIMQETAKSIAKAIREQL